MTNLAHYRKQAKLSQSQLAEAVGISVRTLQDYEQGARNINKASAISVYKMAHVLGVTVENILELEEEIKAGR